MAPRARVLGLLAAVIGVPLELPESLLGRYPELREARYRRGGLLPRVGGWGLGQRTVAAITLWRTVFLAPHTRLDPELLLHELRHVHQFRASGAFPLRYLWESLRRGYHSNQYEADAQAYAARRVRAAPFSLPSQDA
jgi:outer membrane protein TolC